MHVLVAGCGWLGVEIGRRLRERGERVTGVRRSQAACDALEGLGIAGLALDLADPTTLDRLPADLDAVVVCASADATEAASYRRAYIEIPRNLLRATASRSLRALVFTGSTGVFGLRDGSEIDEDTPPSPTDPTAEILVEAEDAILQAAREGIETRLVRASGLYGPGRTGVLDRVRDGALALGPGDETWMNWCHLEDAAATLIAALDRGRRAGIYHATDATPARKREVVTWIAERLGVEPHVRSHGSDAAGGSRRGANRRILGDRSLAELGVSLRYPSFREGLLPLLPAARPARGL